MFPCKYPLSDGHSFNAQCVFQFESKSLFLRHGKSYRAETFFTHTRHYLGWVFGFYFPKYCSSDFWYLLQNAGITRTEVYLMIKRYNLHQNPVR